MNKTHYKNMIYQHLNDGNSYKKLDGKLDNRLKKKICELAQKFDSQSTNKEKLFLTNISFSTSNFYGFPKVHKSRQIKEVI